MDSRWNEPVIPVGFEETDQVVTLPDGRRFAMVAPMLSPSDIERARQGRICLKCQERFEEAWPERCRTCGAPIRRDQADYFAREFAGEILVGPRKTLEEEIAGLDERRREEEEQ